MADFTPINPTIFGVQASPATPDTGAIAGSFDETTPPGPNVIEQARQAFLVVENGSGGSIDVTFKTVTADSHRGPDGAEVYTDLVEAVPDGETHVFGPFGPRFLTVNGKVAFTVDVNTSVLAYAYH